MWFYVKVTFEFLLPKQWRKLTEFKTFSDRTISSLLSLRKRFKWVPLRIGYALLELKIHIILRLQSHERIQIKLSINNQDIWIYHYKHAHCKYTHLRKWTIIIIQTIISATKSRKKQQTELVRSVLYAEADKKRKERESLQITAVPVALCAAQVNKQLFSLHTVLLK